MTRKIKPATLVDCYRIDEAIRELKSTRNLLIEAGALKAAAAVMRAIKSAEGASRHAHHRYCRTQKESTDAQMVG